MWLCVRLSNPILRGCHLWCSLIPSVFSALTWLVGHQGEHPACKKLSDKVTRCWHRYLSGARSKWFVYGPADATATASSLVSLKSGVVFTFLAPAYPGCPGIEAIKRASVFCWFLMQFLAERIEIAKYSSQDQVDILLSLLHCCLPFNVCKKQSMSCHIAALGPRFRWLYCSVNDDAKQRGHCPVLKNVRCTCP